MISYVPAQHSRQVGREEAPVLETGGELRHRTWNEAAGGGPPGQRGRTSLQRRGQNLADRLGQPDMAAALEYRVKNVRRGRPGTRQAPWTPESGDELVPIYLGQVGWGNPRRFGDVYVALRFWKRLGLGNLVSKLVTGRSSEVNALVCAMMVANRLVSPESELGMLGWWGKTSLPELLGLPVESVDDHRLYRSLDAILPHKERIEEHLAGVGRGLFGREYTALLYDLTSTYFEGCAEGISRAKRGYSRDKRPDAKQVCIGIVVDWDGYPVGYEVYDGNVRDHSTVSETLSEAAEAFWYPVSDDLHGSGDADG